MSDSVTIVSDLVAVARLALKGAEEDQELLREDSCGWDGIWTRDTTVEARLAIVRAEEFLREERERGER